MLKSSCFPNRLTVVFYTIKTLRVLPCFPLLETSIRFDLENNPITRLGSSRERKLTYTVIFLLE